MEKLLNIMKILDELVENYQKNIINFKKGSEKSLEHLNYQGGTIRIVSQGFYKNLKSFCTIRFTSFML